MTVCDTMRQRKRKSVWDVREEKKRQEVEARGKGRLKDGNRDCFI